MAQFNWPVVQASLAGGATEATLLSVLADTTAILADTASLDAKTPALGQALAAASVPVVLTAAQISTLTPPTPQTDALTDTQLRASAVPVSVASLPLPTGSATLAEQQSQTTLLGTIDADTSALAGAVSGTEVQVDIVAALPAGTNNIGDVDVLTLPVAYNAGTAGADTQRVVIATDQAAVATKAPVNTNGSIANTSLTATTASTASVPANAVGFVLFADTDNTDTIRFCIGSTASTTVGCKLEPGRDTGYIPCAANVSICSTVSGTNAFAIQWILSA